MLATAPISDGDSVAGDTEFRQLGQIEILCAWRCDSWFTVYFQCILVGGAPEALLHIYTCHTQPVLNAPRTFFSAYQCNGVFYKITPHNAHVNAISFPAPGDWTMTAVLSNSGHNR